MELLEAIKSRKSIRGFKPDSVPTDVLKEIIRVAKRSPSSVNCQPWEFFILKGKVLEALRKASVEQFRSGVKINPDIAVSEAGLEGVYKARQVGLAKQIFAILGITKGDNTRLQAYWELMYGFYNAPTVIVICFDKALTGGWPLVDIGLITQAIVLAAQEYELGSCIIRAAVDYPELVRKIVGVPESKQIILGIAIGYPDWDHPLNNLKTERETLENIVTVIE
jgi:nitroreductase